MSAGARRQNTSLFGWHMASGAEPGTRLFLFTPERPPPSSPTPSREESQKVPYLLWQIPIRCFSEMPLSAVAVTLPRGIRRRFKCTGAGKMTRQPAYRTRHIQLHRRGPLRWWDPSVLRGQNIMTALERKFILTINVCFL